METTPTNRTIIANAPFDDLSGDIILRCSGENVTDFYTYKVFLIYASPVFKDMFSLPENHAIPQNHGLLVVVMHENVKDLRVLLLWCLPGMIADCPTIVEQLYRFYRLADKYLIDSVKVWLQNCAMELIPKTPVGVYVLSRQLGWKEEAKLAAEESLSRELFKLTHESPAFLQDILKLFSNI